MITLENVWFTVETDQGEKDIIKDMTVSLDENKFYVVTGPNGGGKSSLAKLIMGIYTPTQGKITYNGQDITNLSVTDRAKLGIGYAFQHPPRFKGLTVGKLLEIAGWDPVKDELCTVLKIVGLCPDEYLNREIDDSLSGGELKRIEIATILVKRPVFSIFDEPEAGIDLWSFTRLTETFKTYHQDKDTGGLLIISHQERIMQLADEIILVADGRISRQASKEVMLENILNEDEYCDFTCDREVHYNG